MGKKIAKKQPSSNAGSSRPIAASQPFRATSATDAERMALLGQHIDSLEERVKNLEARVADLSGD